MGKTLHYQPIQIMPINRKIDAVYYNGNPKTLHREPVIGMALTEAFYYPNYGEGFDKTGETLLQYITFDDIGIFDFVEAHNLLGYEIDGQEKDWSERIKDFETE